MFNAHYENDMTEQFKALQAFAYDPETGIVTRKMPALTGRGAPNPRPRCHVGDIVGSRKKSGHLSVCFGGKEVLLHRLVWLMLHGAWPESCVDHINGDPADNSAVNLRLATHAQNLANRPATKTNTTGFKNVFKDKRLGRFFAQVMCDGTLHTSCRFATPEEANTAATELRKIHHKEFAHD
jgi:hypothetical protein